MDLSLLRVLEALAPGPATPRILATSYGMGADESEQALAHAVDQGLAEPAGPVAYQLTADGQRTARHELNDPARQRANAITERLQRRDRGIR